MENYWKVYEQAATLLEIVIQPDGIYSLDLKRMWLYLGRILTVLNLFELFDANYFKHFEGPLAFNLKEIHCMYYNYIELPNIEHWGAWPLLLTKTRGKKLLH